MSLAYVTVLPGFVPAEAHTGNNNVQTSDFLGENKQITLRPMRHRQSLIDTERTAVRFLGASCFPPDVRRRLLSRQFP